MFVFVLGACAPKTKVEKPLKTVSVTNDQLADKIKGAWAGQMAGVVLGAKQEFWYPGTMMTDDQVEDFSTLDINHAFWQDDLFVEILNIRRVIH